MDDGPHDNDNPEPPMTLEELQERFLAAEEAIDEHTTELSVLDDLLETIEARLRTIEHRLGLAS